MPMDDMTMDAGGGGPPPGAGNDPGANEPGEMNEGGAVHIPKDMLPKECQDCKAGDMLTFKVVAPADAEGDIPLEYTSMKAAPDDKGWENDFRREMSPRSRGSDTGETMSDGAQQGY